MRSCFACALFLLLTMTSFSARAGDCSGALARNKILDIAISRSTQEMKTLLESKDQKNEEEWITIQLVQDHSQLSEAPDIPPAELTNMAQEAFNEKLKGIIETEGRADDLPRIEKMYFEEKSEDFKGMSVRLTANNVLRLKVKDLKPIVIWYVEGMVHPALGNSAFKISVL